MSFGWVRDNRAAQVFFFSSTYGIGESMATYDEIIPRLNPLR